VSPSGSVPEVLEDKKTGYVVHTLRDAVKAVKNIPLLSRRECRETFEQRFSSSRMARDYLGIYEHVISDERSFALGIPVQRDMERSSSRVS